MKVQNWPEIDQSIQEGSEIDQSTNESNRTIKTNKVDSATLWQVSYNKSKWLNLTNCPSVSVNFQWAREKNISLLRLNCSCRVASSTWFLSLIRFSVAIIWNSLRQRWRMSNSSLLEFTVSFNFWTSFSRRSSWARPLRLILGGDKKKGQNWIKWERVGSKYIKWRQKARKI